MADRAGDSEALAGREAASELAVPTASVALPLIIGCAIMGVAMLMAYSFLRSQEEKQARAISLRTNELLEQSLDAMKRRDYVAAEALASEAIGQAEAIRSGSDLMGGRELLAAAFLCRGEARAGLGSRAELQEAADDYGRCLDLTPSQDDRFLAYYGRGQVLFRMGLPAEAADDFSRALCEKPYSAAAYSGRASARRRLGMDKEADADLRRARELNPLQAPDPEQRR